MKTMNLTAVDRVRIEIACEKIVAAESIPEHGFMTATRLVGQYRPHLLPESAGTEDVALEVIGEYINTYGWSIVAPGEELEPSLLWLALRLEYTARFFRTGSTGPGSAALELLHHDESAFYALADNLQATPMGDRETGCAVVSVGADLRELVQWL